MEVIDLRIVNPSLYHFTRILTFNDPNPIIIHEEIRSGICSDRYPSLSNGPFSNNRGPKEALIEMEPILNDCESMEIIRPPSFGPLKQSLDSVILSASGIQHSSLCKVAKNTKNPNSEGDGLILGDEGGGNEYKDDESSEDLS